LKPKPTPPPKTPASGTDASGNPLRLETYNDNTFGFMRMTVSASQITGKFITVDPTSGKTGVGDSFTVDLKAGKVSNGATTGTSSSPAVKSKLLKSAAKPSESRSKSKQRRAR
jgi:hypothetical protein